MVSSNKILTVSYGTFSCTLEGFDESFETMKAIAEYFRDLAADDRYFGAEPPQPDAEMLARIAQREIERRVEARQDAAGIHLRAATPALAAAVGDDASDPSDARPDANGSAAQDDDADAALPEALDRAVETAVAEGEQAIAEISEVADHADAELAALIAAETDDAEAQAPEPVAEDQAEPEAVAQEDAQPEPVVEADAVSEPVAEADAQPEPLAEDVMQPERLAEAQAEPEPVANDAEPEAVAEDDAQPEPVAEADAVTEPVAEADAQPEAVAEAQAEPEPLAEAEAQPEPEPAIAADSIAAKLQRIRDVVARKGQVAEEYTEDQHADAMLADTDTGDGIADAMEDSGEDAIEDAARAEDVVAALDRIDRAAADPDQDAARPPATEPEAEASAETGADTQPEDEDDALFADLDDDGDDDDDDDDALPENLLADDTVAADAPPPSRARVLKVKRAELEEAIASGMLEEVEDDDDSGAPELSAEEEADLLRELAAVEAEFETAQPDPATDEDTARPMLSPRLDDDGKDVSRLMAAAGDKLEQPETASNRETYSHMRAAVAATRARIEAGQDDPSADEKDSAYRDDLASVVRPRRPEPRDRARARPSARPQSAPLKLVAEQRIDDAAAQAPRGPVRPRRVATTEPETVEAGAGGFAEFARDAGAVELPELLEAAAAYMSFVEGRDQFSRPQLMTKVRQSGAPDFNREDGLRSFGQLLREGKIEKVGGGRFVATEGIGFHPGARAVG